MGSTIRSNILLEAEELDYGQTRRGSCPFCNRETFTVTRTETGVLFNCYRDSCRRTDNSSGFIGLDTVVRDLKRPKPGRKVRFYEGDIRVCEDAEFQYLRQRFNLCGGEVVAHGIRYAPHFTNGGTLAEPAPMGRYVMPVQDPRGYVRGHILRTWDKRSTGSKAILYPHSPDAPMMSWHQPIGQRLGDHVIVVEDQMSAIRASTVTGMYSVALLGTSLGGDKVEELMAWKPSNVIVALDADATDTAFQIVWDHRLLFPRIRVATLHCDIKDMRTDEEIEETLYG